MKFLSKKKRYQRNNGNILIFAPIPIKHSITYQVTDGFGLPYAKQFIIAFDPKDQIEFSTARGSL